MTSFDYAVLVIIGLSVALSVMRGLVREVIALAGWVVAFVVANLFSGTVAPWLPAGITEGSIRMLVAFAILFVLTLFAAALAALAASRLVRSVGLGAEDRVLGGFFGLARGLLIVMILVLLAGLTALPRQPVWNNAMLSAPLEDIAVSVKPWLPRQVSQYIRYDRGR
jgi:membrane protein required for colicin V production